MHQDTRPSGQSMVEFALIAPLLFLLLCGIIEMGIMFNIYVGITNTAREAARAGAVYQYTSTQTTQVDAATIDAQRLLSINSAITGTLNPMISATAIASTVVYTPSTALDTNPYRAGDFVSVSLVYNYKPFFGILKLNPMQLQANSTMKIEPGGVR